MNITYVTTIRFPSERAHALYVSLVLDAFKTLGHTVSVIVPRRFGREKISPRVFYSLKNDIEVHVLPTVDTTYIPMMNRFSYMLYTASFIVSIIVFVVSKTKNDTYFFANDMIVAYALAVFGRHVVYEVHDYPHGHLAWYRSTFARVAYVLVNTEEKKKDLEKEFALDSKKIIVAHNGVNFEKFNSVLTREHARRELSLPLEKKIVLYTGSLFTWKGVDTLARAVEECDVEAYFVGGNDADRTAFMEKYASIKNIHVEGHVAHERMPLWLRAADVLVIPNSAQNSVSERHTSPMKLFEYMASGTPIIASDVFSLREILKENEGYFVTPDSSDALRDALEKICQNTSGAEDAAKRAQNHAKDLSWTARAQHILGSL